MNDNKLIANMTREIAYQSANPRFVGRKSEDGSCGEIVDTMLDFKVIGRRWGEKGAKDEAKRMNRRHLATRLLKIVRGEAK